jgi:hypothetical protein
MFEFFAFGVGSLIGVAVVSGVNRLTSLLTDTSSEEWRFERREADLDSNAP